MRNSKLVLLLVSLFVVSLSGCMKVPYVKDSINWQKGTNFTTYLRPEATLHKVKKIAVMPFDNFSKDKMAGEKIAGLLRLYLMEMGSFEVLEPGIVEAGLKKARIRATKGMSTISDADAKSLGEALGIQGIIVGLIETWDEGKESPMITVRGSMIEAKSGKPIWICDYTTTGASSSVAFDVGKIESLDLLERMMVQTMIQPLIEATSVSKVHADIKINEVESVAKSTEDHATYAEGYATELEQKAAASEAAAKKAALESEQMMSEAIRMNPQLMQQKVAELENEYKAAAELAEMSEAKAVEFSDKLEGMKAKVSEQVEVVEETKSKTEKKKGEINVFTAKERVARIRKNNQEADKYKKLAEEARAEADEFQAEQDRAQEQLDEMKLALEGQEPEANKMQEESQKAKIAAVELKKRFESAKKEYDESNIPITKENIEKAAAKKQEADQKKAEVDRLQQEAAALRGRATKAREEATKAREEAEKKRQEAEEIRARLS